jgi:hypothetical protein
MTHQMHYTSCPDGVEGLRGFQVSAMSAGAPWPLVQLAVRHSVYELGPEFSATDSRHPVRYGYAVSAQGWTVFRSCYLGTEFTGRMGNYFAHAILADGPFAADDALPVDLYRSDFWVSRPVGGKILPAVGQLRAAPAPDSAVAAFLAAAPNRLDYLAVLVSAVQAALTGGRTILMVSDPGDEMMWLTAVTRSLPRVVALKVTFVTYTTRPGHQDVVVACTVPSAEVSGFDGTVLDVSSVARGPQYRVTAYGETLRRSWDNGWPSTVVAIADDARIPIIVSDLDTLARIVDREQEWVVDEPGLLHAANLAASLPQAEVWDAVVEQIDSLDGVTDLAGWASVLRKRSCPALTQRYLDAALVDGGAAVDLPTEVIEALCERIANMPGAAVWRLRPDVAEQVAGSGRVHGRTLRNVEVALARHRASGRVRVLRCISEEQPADLAAVAKVLWDEPPDSAEIDEALVLDDQVLLESGLARHFLKHVLAVWNEPITVRLVAMAEKAASALPPEQIDDDQRVVLAAFEYIRSLGRQEPLTSQNVGSVGPVVAVASQLVQAGRHALAHRLWTAIQVWMRTVTDPVAAARVLDSVVEHGQVSAYRTAICRALSEAGSDVVAATFTSWARLERGRLRQQLLHQTLPKALRGHGSLDLSKVKPAVARDCRSDWLRWRARHWRPAVIDHLFRPG